eukprot:gb/GFBE01044275.1/.p1 GENE.gb/GFBE01044275.1/~~gb/GFBE01044275.1/.p1  ORF type:complete len:495 (+),score=79.96 gb/GFBE01044275.1/:1-1485(+)
MRLAAVLLAVLCRSALGADDVAFPLRASGRYVVDRLNKRVKLACVAWSGAQTKTFVPNGLYKRSPQEIAARIASMGFNCVRIPFSTELYVRNPAIKPTYISKLKATTDRTALDVLDEVVAALSAQRLMIVFNSHLSAAGWCCDIVDKSGVWFTTDYPEGMWTSTLGGMAKRYRSNSYVVGYDIRNEPRPSVQERAIPVWGDTRAFWPLKFVDLREASESAATAILEEDQDALIIVELLHFAQYLCAHHVRDYPLRVPKKHIVWSPHDFFWFSQGINWWQDVCAQEMSSVSGFLGAVALGLGYILFDNLLKQEYIIFTLAAALLLVLRWRGQTKLPCARLLVFTSVLVSIVSVLTLISWPVLEAMHIDTYEKFVKSRDAVWGHFALHDVGPVWVGEFGENNPSHWWNWTMQYMQERDLDFSYWALDSDRYPPQSFEHGDNVEGWGQDDDYGLLNNDYETVRHDWKLEGLQSLMAPQDTTRTSSKGATELDVVDEL